MRGTRLRRRLKDAHSETALFRTRALAAFALVLLAVLGLLAQYARLQIVEHEEFTTRSELNRVKLRPLPPSRGLIFDRNGVLLADNQPAYRLEIVPEQVEDLEKLLEHLRAELDLSDEDIAEFHKLRRARRSFHGIPLRFRLTEEEVARLAIDRHRYPGVEIVPYLTRHYPLGDLVGHLVGYVGRIDVNDQAKLDQGRYAATSHVGKTGIERYYEDRLHGDVGYERVETNAQGRVIRVLGRTSPVPGTDLYLSVDSRLQAAAVAAFEGRNGAAVVIDPRNGDVLAMVSLPSYDPNPFVNGVTHAHYRSLIDGPGRPLFNRALQGGYEPGSTFKPFMALAGLELGVRDPGYTVFSTGAFKLPGHSQLYRDWRKGGHGRVDVVEALAQSVNFFFYELASDLGIDRIHDYVGQFGFGSRTGIDLDGEISGILPSKAWKQAQFSQPWYPGETVITGIGQGYVVATPLQMAHATALLAARGQGYRPHLLLAERTGFQAALTRTSPEAVVPIPARDIANWEIVYRGMVAVMHSPTGTAREAARTSPYRIAGKTGTAQRYSRDDSVEYDENAIPEHLRHQALFVAFAPAESPRVAIAVVVEHGGSGSRAAAPVARRILDAWLLGYPDA